MKTRTIRRSANIVARPLAPSDGPAWKDARRIGPVVLLFVIAAVLAVLEVGVGADTRAQPIASRDAQLHPIRETTATVQRSTRGRRAAAKPRIACTSPVMFETPAQNGCGGGSVQPIGGNADPFVMIDSADAAYLYATQTAEHLLPVTYHAANGAISTTNALSDVPTWSTSGAVWAPAVVETDDGFVMFYSTRHAFSGQQCVSRATASTAVGPFVDLSTEPFVCQHELGGTIDPSVVRSSTGELYLLFKNDGNCCDIPTGIYSQQLTADAGAVLGTPKLLIEADQDWEGGIVEGPSMIELPDGTYLLSYSANFYDGARYATGFAMCSTPMGPCEKIGGPWQPADTDLVGIGGAELLATGSELTIVYHGWPADSVGVPDARAVEFTDPTPLDEVPCVFAEVGCERQAAKTRGS